MAEFKIKLDLQKIADGMKDELQDMATEIAKAMAGGRIEEMQTKLIEDAKEADEFLRLSHELVEYVNDAYEKVSQFVSKRSVNKDGLTQELHAIEMRKAEIIKEIASGNENVDITSFSKGIDELQDHVKEARLQFVSDIMDSFNESFNSTTEKINDSYGEIGEKLTSGYLNDALNIYNEVGDVVGNLENSDEDYKKSISNAKKKLNELENKVKSERKKHRRKGAKGESDESQVSIYDIEDESQDEEGEKKAREAERKANEARIKAAEEKKKRAEEEQKKAEEEQKQAEESKMEPPPPEAPIPEASGTKRRTKESGAPPSPPSPPGGNVPGYSGDLESKTDLSQINDTAVAITNLSKQLSALGMETDDIDKIISYLKEQGMDPNSGRLSATSVAGKLQSFKATFKNRKGRTIDLSQAYQYESADMDDLLGDGAEGETEGKIETKLGPIIARVTEDAEQAEKAIGEETKILNKAKKLQQDINSFISETEKNPATKGLADQAKLIDTTAIRDSKAIDDAKTKLDILAKQRRDIEKNASFERSKDLFKKDVESFIKTNSAPGRSKVTGELAKSAGQIDLDKIVDSATLKDARKELSLLIAEAKTLNSLASKNSISSDSITKMDKSAKDLRTNLEIIKNKYTEMGKAVPQNVTDLIGKIDAFETSTSTGQDRVNEYNALRASFDDVSRSLREMRSEYSLTTKQDSAFNKSMSKTVSTLGRLYGNFRKASSQYDAALMSGDTDMIERTWKSRSSAQMLYDNARRTLTPYAGNLPPEIARMFGVTRNASTGNVGIATAFDRLKNDNSYAAGFKKEVQKQVEEARKKMLEMVFPGDLKLDISSQRLPSGSGASAEDKYQKYFELAVLSRMNGDSAMSKLFGGISSRYGVMQSSLHGRDIANKYHVQKEGTFVSDTSQRYAELFTKSIGNLEQLGAGQKLIVPLLDEASNLSSAKSIQELEQRVTSLREKIVNLFNVMKDRQIGNIESAGGFAALKSRVDSFNAFADKVKFNSGANINDARTKALQEAEAVAQNLSDENLSGNRIDDLAKKIEAIGKSTTFKELTSNIDAFRASVNSASKELDAFYGKQITENDKKQKETARMSATESRFGVIQSGFDKQYGAIDKQVPQSLQGSYTSLTNAYNSAYTAYQNFVNAVGLDKKKEEAEKYKLEIIKLRAEFKAFNKEQAAYSKENKTAVNMDMLRSRADTQWGKISGRYNEIDKNALNQDDTALVQAYSELTDAFNNAKTAYDAFKNSSTLGMEEQTKAANSYKKAIIELQTRFNGFNASNKASLDAVSKLKADTLSTYDTLDAKVKKAMSDSRVSKDDPDYGNLQKAYTGLENAKNELKTKKDALETANGMKATKTAANEYKKALEELIIQLNLFSKAQEEANKFDSYRNSYSDFEVKMKNIESVVRNSNKALGQTIAGDKSAVYSEMAVFKEAINNGKFDDAAASYDKIVNSLNNMNAAIKTYNTSSTVMGTKITDTAKRLLGLSTSFSIVQRAFSETRKIVDYVTQIDTAMVNLRKVVDASDDALARFQSRAFESAKEIGTDAISYINAVDVFAKMGESLSSSESLGKTATVFANVADFSNVDEASSVLVSSMKAFDIATNDAMSIADKLNAVSNKYAVTAQDISKGLEMSASSMASTGNNIDQTIAMITTISEITRDAGSAGSAIKVLSMRLRGAKVELEDAGESTDGMAESTSKLREQILALTNVEGKGGFDIMKNGGTEFKSTYDIMLGISNVWKEMSDIDQSALLELIAGKVRGNQIAALLNNMSQAENILATSVQSSGSAMEEHSKWIDSIVAKQNQLKASWEQLSQSIINSSLIKGTYDAGSGLLGLLNDIVTKFGSGSLLLGGGITAFLRGNGLFNGVTGKAGGLFDMLGTKNINKSHIERYNNIFNGMKEGDTTSSIDLLRQQSLEKLKEELKSTGEELSGLEGKIISASKTGVASVNGFGAALTSVKLTVKSLGTALLSSLALTGISLAISGIVTLISNAAQSTHKLIDKSKELYQQWDDNKKSYKDAKKTVEDVGKEFEKLGEGVNPNGDNISLAADEYDRYKQICNDIAAVMPDLVKGYDEQGNAILNVTNGVEGLNDALEELKRKNFDEIIRNSETFIKGKLAGFQKESGITKLDTETGEEKISPSEIYASLGKLVSDNDVAKLNNREAYVVRSMLNDEYGISYYDTLNNDNFQEIINERIQQIRSYYSVLGASISSFNNEVSSMVEAYVYNSNKNLTPDQFDIISQLYKNLDYTQFNESASAVDIAEYVQNNIVDPIINGDMYGIIQSAIDTQTRVLSGKAAVSQIYGVIDGIKAAAKSNNLKQAVAESILDMFDISSIEKDVEVVANNLEMKAEEIIASGMTIGDLNIAANLGQDVWDTIDSLEALRSTINGIKESTPDMASNIINAFNATAEAQKTMNDTMKDATLTGSISYEQYQALIKANKEFASAIDTSTGNLSMNYREMRRLVSAQYASQLTQAKTAKELNLTKYKKNAEDIKDLEKQMKSLENGTEDYNNVLKKYNELLKDNEGIRNEIKDLDLLVSSIRNAASAYKQWQDARGSVEYSDTFDSLKDAVQDIKTGIESKRVNTNTFVSAMDLVFGENWEQTFNGDYKKVKKQADEVEKLFKEKGQGVSYGINKLYKSGVLGMGKNGDYFTKEGKTLKDFSEALGISAEMTKYFLNSLRDYGFNVNIETPEADTSKAIQDYSEKLVAYEKIKEEYQSLLNNFDYNNGEYDKGKLDEIIAKYNELTSAKKELDESEAGLGVEYTEEELSAVDAMNQKIAELQAAFATLKDSTDSAAIAGSLVAINNILNDIASHPEGYNAAVNLVVDSEKVGLIEKANTELDSLDKKPDPTKTLSIIYDDTTIGDVEKAETVVGLIEKGYLKAEDVLNFIINNPDDNEEVKAIRIANLIRTSKDAEVRQKLIQTLVNPEKFINEDNENFNDFVEDTHSKTVSQTMIQVLKADDINIDDKNTLLSELVKNGESRTVEQTMTQILNAKDIDVSLKNYAMSDLIKNATSDTVEQVMNQYLLTDGISDIDKAKAFTKYVSGIDDEDVSQKLVQILEAKDIDVGAKNVLMSELVKNGKSADVEQALSQYLDAEDIDIDEKNRVFSEFVNGAASNIVAQILYQRFGGNISSDTKGWEFVEFFETGDDDITKTIKLKFDNVEGFEKFDEYYKSNRISKIPSDLYSGIGGVDKYFGDIVSEIIANGNSEAARNLVNGIIENNIELVESSTQDIIDEASRIASENGKPLVNASRMSEYYDELSNAFIEFSNKLDDVKPTITIEADTDSAQIEIDNFKAKNDGNIISDTLEVETATSDKKLSEFIDKYDGKTIRVNVDTGNVGGGDTGHGGKFASGTMNAPQGVSLVGEGYKNGKYQPELVVHSRTGEYFVTDHPQLVNLERGDQVFNGDDTRKILSGKSKLSGKSYAKGVVIPGASANKVHRIYAGDDGNEPIRIDVNVNADANAKADVDGKPLITVSDGGNGNGKSVSMDKYKKLVDWIPRALEVLKEKTDSFIRTAEKAVDYVVKNHNLDQAINNVNEEIDLTRKAYDRYMQQADEVAKYTKLSDEIIEKIRLGTINIEEYDDKTREYITEYQKWFNNANKLKETIEGLEDQLTTLAKQKLTNIVNQFDMVKTSINDNIELMKQYVEEHKAVGKEVFGSEYDSVISNSAKIVSNIQKERDALRSELNNLIDKGLVKIGDDVWYEYTSKIVNLDKAISETTVNIQEFSDIVKNIPVNNIQTASKYLNNIQNSLQGVVDLWNAQGKDIASPTIYNAMIDNAFDSIDALEQQNAVLREQLEGLDVLSDKYQEIYDKITDNENAIMEAKKSQEEWNDMIIDSTIARLEKQNEKYQDSIKLMDTLSDLEKANQRTMNVYREGVGFVYEADPNKVKDAQKAVSDVVYEQIISGLEESKANSNIYDDIGNLIEVKTDLNGIDFSKYYDTISAGTENSSILSSALSAIDIASLVRSAAQSNVDINLSGMTLNEVNDVKDLSDAIIQQLPTYLLQYLYNK